MRAWIPAAAIPAAALALVLLNALYGHLAFSSSHPEDIAKFSVYVHLRPGWESHPGNLLFDVTNVWNNRAGPGGGGVYYGEAPAPPPDPHNHNRLEYAGDRPFVRLEHRFSDCRDNWQPVLYRYGIDTLRNQLDVAAGRAHPPDHPYAVMYRSEAGRGGAGPSQGGYAQFVPVCSSSGTTTSYEYSVRSNDAGLSFDVYFVPDRSGYEGFARDGSSDSIEAYPGEGCSGRGYTSFSGRCEGVSVDAGLLIWIPDDLGLALTKVTVNLREV